MKLSNNGEEYDHDYRGFEDQTINHEDLFRAFSSEGGFLTAEELLGTLTNKFNRLIEALKHEEQDKKKCQR